MALISIQNISWGLGGAPILDSITLQIEKGERVCLLGRNGVGKSTLLKMIIGEIEPDAGEILRQKGLQTAILSQDVPQDITGPIFDFVSNASDEPKKIESVLSQAKLDKSIHFESLSAGMKRRVLFAKAMVSGPDVLLLDEPTNHLDIPSILWLESFLLKNVKTLLFVAHDRVFVQKMATRIVELDRGFVSSYGCDYQTYLQRRQEVLEAEETQEKKFKKKLSQEETWIRQGIKARRTRNEGRVRALKKLRETNLSRRKKIGNVNLEVQEAQRSGKIVIHAQNVSYIYNNTPLIKNFSTLIMRGDKVGIIGPNGSGKTTLLRILLKKISPTDGHIRHGTNLEVVYFDQLRSQLNLGKTVFENIGEGNDFITFNNQKRHVVSYLQDFLFSPDRCRTPVSILSGGEKNRLLLAKLFTKPANILVLDEPTNDLDAETLELLEELLFEYKGTLLLVSHDRAFLNNVVTSTLVFEDNCQVNPYPGGYDDWLNQRPHPTPIETPVKKNKKPEVKKNTAKTKLGFNEKRELENLPSHIDALEKEQQNLFDTMSDPLFYSTDKEEIIGIKSRLEVLEITIETAYQRWEELEQFLSR